MNFIGNGGVGATITPMFSAAALFSTYTSITAFITLIQQFYHQFVPEVVRLYISKTLQNWFTKSHTFSPLFTLVIEQYEDDDYDLSNQVYFACESYIAKKLKSTAKRLKASRHNTRDNVSFKLAQDEKYCEQFDGVEFQWSFIRNKSSDPNNTDENNFSYNKFFELTVDPSHKDKIFDAYLPYILRHYEEMTTRKKELKLYSCDGGSSSYWKAVTFEHPFTFDSLAIDPDLKNMLIDDLERFMKRKEFYKKVGRAWKRGYLLYGPPGTGKSSLIAAMANHLKFDVYDLQLSSVHNDAILRRLLLSTTNGSILIIEDIDCNLGLSVRERDFDGEIKSETSSDTDKGSKPQISLSALLNFVDGLWSSCGDERIIVFTTNYKERLDPALLRPGRMDMHIHMSYLTMSGFRTLASNYLDLCGEDHPLFGEIGKLLEGRNVTPAQVAEELIRSDDPDIALSNVVDMLNASPRNDNVVKLVGENEEE